MNFSEKSKVRIKVTSNITKSHLSGPQDLSESIRDLSAIIEEFLTGNPRESVIVLMY